MSSGVARILALLFGANLGTSAALAQFQYERLWSFDYSDPSTPGYVVEGSDGKLYGTTTRGGGDYGNGGTLYKLNVDGTDFQVLHNFGGIPDDGQGGGRLVEGRDGALYGNTGVARGTTGYVGTVFKINKDGSNYVVLHRFVRETWDVGPPGGLIEGSEGTLYGTTAFGGPNMGDTVFALNRDGTDYQVLYKFSGGQSPVGILEGDDGTLYGTTRSGLLFKLKKDGSGFAVLHSFPGTAGDGQSPNDLVQASDGLLYGTTTSGGRGGMGILYKLTKDGSNYTLVHNFSSILSDGRNPSGGLLEGRDGALYGVTSAEGNTNTDYPDGLGTIFKLNKDGSGFTVLRRFISTAEDAKMPSTGMLQSRDGALYGATQSGGAGDSGTVFKLNNDGSGYLVLHSFFASVGGHPRSALVEANDGALYGTTDNAVFKLNKNGTGYTVLRSEGRGSYNLASLFEASDGAFYGTLSFYTETNSGRRVFKFNADGTGYTVLRQFDMPFGGGEPFPNELIEGSDGFLFGTTPAFIDSGTLFKLGKDGGQFTLLHEFGNTNNDGIGPGTLLEGRDGVLYGTTRGGGSSTNDFGQGTLFKIKKDGSDYRILHNFDLPTGSWPTGTLVVGTDGVLYGTTDYGGLTNAAAPFGFGTIFRLNTDGAGYAILHTFADSGGDGFGPNGLSEGDDGFLYGAATSGGKTNSTSPNGLGTIFRLRKDGSGYEVLHSFLGGPGDGQLPFANVTRGNDGAFYGTTWEGGQYNLGTIFVLRPPVPPLPKILRLTTFPAVTGGFTSVGGSTNQVLRAGTVTGAWQLLTNMLVPVNGVAEFSDATPPKPNAFYRVLRK
jgi:uncharacterized repeat protein (TIGR03803 family)